MFEYCLESGLTIDASTTLFGDCALTRLEPPPFFFSKPISRAGPFSLEIMRNVNERSDIQDPQLVRQF